MTPTTPTGSASPTGLADRAAQDFRAYRTGDEAALGRLIHTLTPLLWHTARGTGLDAATAEDVVQETWLALYRSAATITSAQAVLQWLLTTARRRSVTAARKLARTPVVEPPGPESPGTEVSSPDPAPETLVVGKESDEVLWRSFLTLSQRCQYLLRVLAMGDRPDYAKIADSLGMPIGSIGPTRGRCLAKLRLTLTADPAWSGSHG